MSDRASNSMTTRRDVLRAGASAALVATLPRQAFAFTAGLVDGPHGGRRERAAWSMLERERPHLTNALDAARWIAASRIVTDHGVAWPADPRMPGSVGIDLYSGTPGIVLFLLELHGATGDAGFLDEACMGADYLVAQLRTPGVVESAGLYEGASGIAYTLQQVYESSRRPAYRDAARAALARVHALSRRAGAGVEWSDVTDIVSGSAGTGLFLLWAARVMGDAPSRALAAQAGRRLIELGRRTDAGLEWLMMPTFPRLMPNFSHGTAGISYFLASLYGETHERPFLDGSVAGAKQLQSIATVKGDGALIYHHPGDGAGLYYLGWCHGPVGTSRLFYRLAEVSGDRSWMEWVRRGANGISGSGIPEERTPGFWNNISQCCGNTGVAQYFLDLHRALGGTEHLAFSRRVTADLMRRATRDDAGLRWIQAENRIDPTWQIAQTGYMQGASGVGTWLLQLDAFEQKRRARISFPDRPYSA